ncbi:hypothetical protein MRB53_006258 [Persea americana]|uniref:Uncharacterized protein n=1 Tax=Persea americana TaxID=3435 RepID=A0ACC2MGF3_PERAE|nr:hypothetical protein MRB53_006258 [Persea americana]
MGGRFSKRIDDLSETDEDVPMAIDLNEINFRVAFQSLSFDTIIEFTGLELQTDDEAAKIVLECKKRTWRNNELSSTFQAYFDISSKLLKSLSPPNQLLSNTNVKEQEEGGQQLKGPLNVFIKEYQSLEKRLLTRNTKINPNRKFYLFLKLVAMIFSMVPYLGPITLTSINGGKPHPAVAAAIVSSAFVACGGIGKWGLSVCNREMKALKVQKEVIGLMLMSIAFQKKDLKSIRGHLKNGLSMQDDVVINTICMLEERLKNERKIILQKLSEYESSAEDNTSEERV